MALSHISTPALRRLFAVGLAVIIALGAVSFIAGTAHADDGDNCLPNYDDSCNSPPPTAPEPPSAWDRLSSAEQSAATAATAAAMGAAITGTVSAATNSVIGAAVGVGVAAALAYMGVDRTVARHIVNHGLPAQYDANGDGKARNCIPYAVVFAACE